MSNVESALFVFVCEVVYAETNWHFVNDSVGNSTGDLLVDDLCNLKTHNFYYVGLDRTHKAIATSPYIWFCDSVSAVDRDMYWDQVSGAVLSNNNYSFFYNDSGKSFRDWWPALNDLAEHIGFEYGPACRMDNNFLRLMGISPVRLFCEDFFLDLIRIHSYNLGGIDPRSHSFGRVRSDSLLDQFRSKFGEV